MVGIMIKITVFLLVSISCVRASLPDLSEMCANPEDCGASVVKNVSGSTLSNFKVASNCVNCTDVIDDIDDDTAYISCKVTGCYSDGRAYEFTSFSKTNQTPSIIDKQICDNPTAEDVEKITIGCLVEHNSRSPVEVNSKKLRISPSVLLDSERLCMKLRFESSPLPPPSADVMSHKVFIEPDLRIDCNDDSEVSSMIVFEFKK